MRLVDSNSGQFFLLIHDLQVVPEVIQLAVFRRDIQKSCVRMAAPEVIEDGLLCRAWSCAVDGLYLDVRGSQTCHLIVHQGKERRDYYRDSEIHDCRKLEA